VSDPFTMTAGAAGGTFVACPPGLWSAVCVALCDLGWQTSEYGGERRERFETFLILELEAEGGDGSRDRYFLGKAFRKSLHAKAALRAAASRLLGKQIGDGDQIALTHLLGRPCLAEVSNGTSKAGTHFHRLEAVTSLPRGMEPLTPTYPPFARACDSDEPLPPWTPFYFGRPLSQVINRDGRQAAAAALDHDDNSE
jgi:hypothetical protein